MLPAFHRAATILLIAAFLTAPFFSPQTGRAAVLLQDSLSFEKHVLDTTFGSGVSLTLVDFDGDGDLDIFYLATDGIRWLENKGSLVFEKHFIGHLDEVTSLAEPGDLDGDGDADIASWAWHAGADYYMWSENLGSGGFTNHILDNAFDAWAGISIADIDTDGDLDIFSPSVTDFGHMGWYENVGADNFTLHYYSSFLPRRPVVFGDFDRDGDLDWAGLLEQDYWAEGGYLFFYENDGSQNYSMHIIMPSGGGPYQRNLLRAADLDSDGDLDLLTALAGTGEMDWWQNDGSAGFTRRNLPSQAGLRSLTAEDLDGDGGTDLILGFDGSRTEKLAWLENDGSQSFQLRTVWSLSDLYVAVDFTAAGDLDADGRKDIVEWSQNCDEGVKVWKNLGVLDHTPPAAVADLSLAAGAFPGDFTLSWTAPGDDGALGTAASYQVRWDVSPITDEADWNAAIPVNAGFSPSPAGTAESFTMNMDPGTLLYFALKTCDEASNCSGLSNSPSVTTPGMLISGINELLETDPESILGKQVMVAGAAARVDDWTAGAGDLVKTHESLVKVLDKIKNLKDVGWALADYGGAAALKVYIEAFLAGWIVQNWMEMRAALITGTQSGEWGDPTLLIWNPTAALPEMGFPYVITGTVKRKDFLSLTGWDYFYYLEVTSSSAVTKITPSSTEKHFPIPAGYTFKDLGDIGLVYTPAGSRVCGIGIVDERYVKGDFAYLRLTLLQRMIDLDHPPVLAQVDKDEKQPNLGALVLACGTKRSGDVGYNWYGVSSYLNTLEDQGGLARLKGHTSTVSGHEAVGQSGLFIHMGSPVDLHVYDQQNRHVGPIHDPATGALTGFALEIPGAMYFYGQGDTPEFIYLPNPQGGEYSIRLAGTGSGTYTMTTSLSDQTGYPTYFNQTAGSTTSGEIDTYTLDEIPSAPKNLTLVKNGSTASLDWDDNTEPDLAGYFVYRQALSGGAVVRLNQTPVTESRFSSSLPAGEAVKYWVTAVDTGHNESGYSKTAAGSSFIYLPFIRK